MQASVTRLKSVIHDQAHALHGLSMVLQIIVEQLITLQSWKYIFVTVLIFIGTHILYKSKKNNRVNENINIDRETQEVTGAAESENKSEGEIFQPCEKEHIPYAGATVTLPGGAEQFYAMVQNRRSIRDFSTRPVDFSIIEKCIHAAGTAPSGAHTEPWTFCVIKDVEMKHKVREIVENEEYINYTQRMHRQWIADIKPLRTNFVKAYLTDAPYLVLVFKQTYGLSSSGVKKQHYYNEISVSIATGVLLCAFQAAGLSSLVTTPLNCGPALRQLLNTPVNEKLLVLLPVGYAAEDCKVPDFQRKPVDEILIKY